MPTIAQTRRDFADVLGRAHYNNERIVVTRRNTPYAAIVSIRDKEILDELDKREASQNVVG